ncbi:MAG: NAD-dependent epimerase/dehydratase family protein [Chlamydiales bacterium]|nr:NAD-dependent epimerase/dehydratase family protein [Chlamydiales bacterium]
MSKIIFLTGAAGFVGYHLAKSLHARGDKVLGYDNFNDYYDVNLKRARAKELRTLGVEVVEGDICNSDQLEDIMSALRPTHVAHMAAQAGVRYSIENPMAYVKSNLEGFVNILEACRRHPGTSLIYASSSSVYGANAKLPFSVTDETNEQVSLYGATKKSNEVLAASYHHLYNMPVTGLRFFTVYGPWGRPDMAYYSFTKAIMESRPIKVFNFGKLQRDFTFIDDIIAGTVSAIDLSAQHEIFNLGNNKPVPLEHFIDVVEHAVGKKAIREELPMQPGDVPATYANIDHSKQLLGFEPKTKLEDGIPKFVQWYKQWAPSQ